MSASNTTDIEAIRAAGAESCRSGRRDASVIFGWPMNRSAPLWRPLRVPREPNRTWSGMRLGRVLIKLGGVRTEADVRFSPKATPLVRSSEMTRWVCQAEAAGARKVLPELIDARAPWVMPLQRSSSR
jgi:hypothetical protein